MFPYGSALLALALAAETLLTPYFGDDPRYEPEQGLVITSGTREDGATLEYERPVVLVPEALGEDSVHSTLRRFVALRDGVKDGVGSHYFEAELLGSEPIEGHPDCVKIRRHALRMDYSGTQAGEDVVEWYARDAGLVKAEGERFWKDASGRVTRTERID